MPGRELPGFASVKRLAVTLTRNLNFEALKSLTKRNSDRGRERYRRAGITASTSFLSKALNIVISFVTVPLTINYLGTERYGVWLTISSILTWMAMTDFGLAGNALVNVLSEAHGKDDRALAREYTASAFWTLTSVAVMLGAVFAAAFDRIPWRLVFRVSESVPTAELHHACAWAIALFLLGLPLSVQNSIYSAYQDGFVANAWGIASNVAALASLIVVAHFHGGLPQLVIALLGTRSAMIFVNVYFLFFRRYTWLIPLPSAIRWVHIKRLFGLGGKYLVAQLSALGIYQSQPMIITQLLGPSQVVIFVVAQKILTLPNDLVYLATVPFVSAFGEARARQDWGWIKAAYKNATLASLGFGIPLIAAIALTARPVIRIWAGAAAVPGTPLILWLSIYTLIGVALMSAGQVLSGLERVNALVLSVTLCAICVIGLAILLAPRWGLSGIAFAMAVSKVFTFWPIQVYEVRRILRASRFQPSTGGAQLVA